MRIRSKRAFSIGVAGIAAALLVGSAVAVAGPGKKPAMLVRGVHTEVSLIKADGTKDAFVVDRGQVTTETQTAVTLSRKDGKSVTLGLNADTKVRGDIQVGKGAIVFSRGGTAFAVLAPRGEHALRLGGGLPVNQGLAALRGAKLKGIRHAVHADVDVTKADGSIVSRSFDRGQVTAASETSVTVKRADGPSVTKSITGDTKVRGKLAVGGRALIVSQGGAALRILAAGPKA